MLEKHPSNSRKTMLQELIDDDNMSSLSSLTELSEEDALPQLVSDARRVSQAAAVIQGTPKRILRKSTQVPHPKTALLKTNIRDRKLCLAKIQKRLIVNVNHDLKYWEEQAPVFRLAGIKLCELKARPKNTAKDKARAQEVMEEMKSWESDGSSGVFQDELGNTLVAYFGRRAGTNIKRRKGYESYNPGPKTPSAMGRSPVCLDRAEREGRKVFSDGIKQQTLDKAMVATQLLIHHVGVQHAMRDGRHDKGDVLMKYEKHSGTVAGSDNRRSFVLEDVEYVYEDDSFASEATGVLHLVHGWPDQAHRPEKHGIHPSADMVSGPHGAPHVHAYFHATETLALRLGEMFRKSFPEFYEKYRKAFDAGKWAVVDPGPFLGRVIVWKLAVLPHQDGLDEGPAVIFPMGRFEGGECYLPDLKLKLSYRPGEVIILMAGALYHGIGEWTPQPGVSEDGITPGRPANWSLERAGGTIHVES